MQEPLPIWQPEIRWWREIHCAYLKNLLTEEIINIMGHIFTIFWRTVCFLCSTFTVVQNPENNISPVTFTNLEYFRMNKQKELIHGRSEYLLCPFAACMLLLCHRTYNILVIFPVIRSTYTSTRSLKVPL